MTKKTLRQIWDENPQYRNEWDAVVNSGVWRMVSEMVKEEATAAVRMFAPGIDGDIVLARKLSVFDGKMQMLEELERAAQPPAPPQPILEEYSDEYVAKIIEQKKNAQH